MMENIFIFEVKGSARVPRSSEICEIGNYQIICLSFGSSTVGR